jgi:hypothetical protein
VLAPGAWPACLQHLLRRRPSALPDPPPAAASSCPPGAGVIKGLEESMSNGSLAGFPVVDVLATLYDGSYHEVRGGRERWGAGWLAGCLAGALAGCWSFPRRPAAAAAEQLREQRWRQGLRPAAHPPARRARPAGGLQRAVLPDRRARRLPRGDGQVRRQAAGARHEGALARWRAGAGVLVLVLHHVAASAEAGARAAHPEAG